MAAKLWLVTLLVLSAWLVVAKAQDESENEIVDEPGEGVIRPISDERRRERLRSFFTRRREESLKTSSENDEDTKEEPSEASTQRTRSRFVRPRVTSPRPATTQDDEDDLEGFSTEKVSVSISKSVSTSVARRVSPIRIFNRRKEENKSEEDEASVEVEEAPKEKDEKPKFTQRKRFRLTKTSARNRGSLVEKVLANIDKQNEVETTGDRRIRFRPSIRRENIRKKVQEAVGSDEVATERPRPRFRPSGRGRESQTTTINIPTTTTETTIDEDYIVAEQEPIDIVTEPIVVQSETLPPPVAVLDQEEFVPSTLAPTTFGFFPTVNTFVPASEQTVPTVPTTTTITTTTTTTTKRPRGLFRRKGIKRFRPQSKIREQENNEIEEVPEARERFRSFKLPRRLNKFRPSESAIRRRPVSASPRTTVPVTEPEPEVIVTTQAPVATTRFAPVVTATEVPAPVSTLRPAFTFFGADSSPTPSTVRKVEVEEPVRIRKPQPAFQPALLNEVPRSSAPIKTTVKELSPSDPAVFQQNIDFRPQPQSVRVAPPPPVRVAPQQHAIRAQVPQRRPPQPQQVRAQPQQVRAQPQQVRVQPQPVRQQPQVVAK